MKDDGYTLAETLVALAVIGLAMGGLMAAVRVISSNQAASSRSLDIDRQSQALALGLTRLLAGAGPFGDDAEASFIGDGSGLAFDCRRTAPCSAHLANSGGRIGLRISGQDGPAVLPIPGVQGAHFVYIGTRSMGSVWPSGSKDPDRLRVIELVGDGVRGTTALVTTPIWREQGSDCVFDPISGGCRKPTS